jgi:hypothetical protein
MSDYGRRNNTPTAGTPTRKLQGPGNSSKRGVRIISRNGVITLFSNTNSISAEALAELQQNGYVSEQAAPLIEDRSLQTIDGLGFMMVEMEELSPGLDGSLKDFSLIGSTNIDETIQNSKIVDPDLEKLTPVKNSAGDKFKDQADSFYDLDQERPQAIKNKETIEKRKSKKVALTVARKLSASTKKSQNKMLNKKNKRSLKR